MKTEPQHRLLRITDQETARVVAIHNSLGEVVGSGCLLDDKHVLTCHHVVMAALKNTRKEVMKVKLIGVPSQPIIEAGILKLGNDNHPATDIAVLALNESLSLANAPVEFSAPLRHGGKRFSVFGFPEQRPQGRNASGWLHATDADGLVQMDAGGQLRVEGGFSGAPVWSPDLGGFVGILVTEQSEKGISWCIPSQLLCDFYKHLLVRFRVPPSDRPQIYDYEEDDPNLQIFGTLSNNGHRKLTAKIKEEKDEEGDKYYKVVATYECLTGSPSPRGSYVTFITHPSFASEDEDAYELFARVDKDTGKAKVEFYPLESFTMAAIGDAGGSALTFDLSKMKNKPEGF